MEICIVAGGNQEKQITVTLTMQDDVAIVRIDEGSKYDPAGALEAGFIDRLVPSGRGDGRRHDGSG